MSKLIQLLVNILYDSKTLDDLQQCSILFILFVHVWEKRNSKSTLCTNEMLWFFKRDLH